MVEILTAIRALLALTRSASAILLALSVVVNFANIIGRYFFNVSITWAEEIMLFLMVGCVFTGCCAVAWENRQIRMDVFVGLMPERAKNFFALLAELLLLAVAVWIVSVGTSPTVKAATIAVTRRMRKIGKPRHKSTTGRPK